MARNVPMVQKAAVAALSSLFGTTGMQLTRPVPRRGLMGPSEPYAGAWQRGVEAEPLADLTSNAAVYACLSRISRDIAKLALVIMEDATDGTKQTVNPASPFWRPLRSPNHYQNRIQFLAYWLISKLLYGNAYALKARTASNVVARLYLIAPRLVAPLVTPSGDVYYKINSDPLALVPHGITVPASEIIHDRMNCLWHPLMGVAPIYAAAISATQGLRIQANSQAFFKNMSRPSGLLTGPGTIDPVTAERLKLEWNTRFSGDNVGRVAVLGDGLTYEPMTMPAEQAQLIEQLRWTVEDVGRAFQMPLYKIGAGAMPTNNNVEALNQQYYDDCLQPYIEDIEQCLSDGLEVPSTMRVEFDLSGLLRMDQTAQVKMLGEGVKGGIFTPNEARLLRNLPPLEGGDTVYLQEQDHSLAALAKRDAGPDPFGSAKPPAPTPAPTPAPAPADGEQAADKVASELIAKFMSAEALPF